MGRGKPSLLSLASLKYAAMRASYSASELDDLASR